MRSATLDELCEINVGRTPARAEPAFWGSGHRWLSIADMNQGLSIRDTKEQITAAGARAGKVVQPGTVLLSFKLSIGKVAIADVPLYTNEAIAALPIKDDALLDARYLMRALQAMDLASGSNRAAMGATLNKRSLAQIQLPLVSLPEQRRIAAILDQADAIRAKRRQVRAHLDSLTHRSSTTCSVERAPRMRAWLTSLRCHRESRRDAVQQLRPRPSRIWRCRTSKRAT